MNQYSYIDFKFEQGKCQAMYCALSIIIVGRTGLQLKANLERGCGPKRAEFLPQVSILEMLLISTSAW